MAGTVRAVLQDWVPGYRRLERLPGQLLRRNPFVGTVRPTRVPLFAPGSGRPTLPFPHPWNYAQPLRILETYFWKAEAEEGAGRHNRFLDVPWFAPVLVTRDPAVIREISANTGDRPGQFDRDTLPSRGIARATGRDSLLYAKNLLHFGFGHGPRFCPGKSLGQLEVALAVGACIKLFRVEAVNTQNEAKAGVSTKPLDGVLVDLYPRESAATGVKAEHPGQARGLA